MFSREFLKENGFTDCKVLGRFASKRNQLFHLSFTDICGSEKQFVYKFHNYRTRLAREIEMLFLLKNSPVLAPDLIKVIGNGYLMEYISGPTILDYASWQEKIHFQFKEPHTEPAMQAITQLAEWLKNFYEVTERNLGKKMVLGNLNLRNFIIRDKLYGVDFEDCREGCREEDIGRVCAFSLTYTPPYTTWKKAFTKEMINLFVNKLELNQGHVIDCFFSELEQINKRRGYRTRAGWLEDVFRTI